MDKNTIAYCAGYIDGDGCFSIQKIVRKTTGTVKYHPSIVVSSTDINVLNFFRETFGGTVTLSSKKIAEWKPQYHFYFGGKKCLKMCEELLPFLVEKKDECEVFINFLKNPCKEVRENLFQEIKSIKNESHLITRENTESLKEIRNTIQPSEIDFCYLSGFIDAECCLTLTRDKPAKHQKNLCYKASLLLNNSKIPIFKWLMSRFGGRAYFLNRNEKNIKHRNQICWQLSAKCLSDILPKIFPFLLYKKNVCQELMKFSETIIPMQISKKTEAFKKAYVLVLQERDSIFNKVHLLNRKGVNHSSG
jgi:hypothetical protein